MTAREWKIPPLAMLGLTTGRHWTETDRHLALAFHAYEQALCPCCGQPKRLAHNPEMDGWYEATETVCAACAAKDRWQADHSEKHPEPGLLLGIADTRTIVQQMGGIIPR